MTGHPQKMIKLGLTRDGGTGAGTARTPEALVHLELTHHAGRHQVIRLRHRATRVGCVRGAPRRELSGKKTRVSYTRSRLLAFKSMTRASADHRFIIGPKKVGAPSASFTQWS